MQYLIHFLQKHCLWLRQESSFEPLPGAILAVFLFVECIQFVCYIVIRGGYPHLRPLKVGLGGDAAIVPEGNPESASLRLLPTGDLIVKRWRCYISRPRESGDHWQVIA